MATKINYEEIKEGLEAAQSDTTPFLIPDEELTVVGDANKTELNIHDFEIKFRMPQKQEDGTIKQITGTKEYKGVYITPRVDTAVVKLMTKLMPYYKKPLEDGGVSDLSPEETVKIIENFSDDIIDVLYETVGTFLRIDPALRDYMTVDSVMSAAAKIIRQFPEVANEADTFFG